MKRLAVLALALVGLVGCAPTQQVLTSGHRYEYSSNFPPRKLAGCTAFNAGSFNKRYIGQVEPLVRPDTYQVVVTRIAHWHFEPIIVAHTTPSPAGSQIVVFVSNDMGPKLAEDWIERLRSGCEQEMRPAIVVPVPVVPTEYPPAPRPLPASPLPQRRGTRG